MDWVAPLIALATMEIVLGIDNVVFIAIVSARLPESQQKNARRLGLLVALVSRLLLLFTIKWIIGMKEPIFHLTEMGIPEGWLPAKEEGDTEHFDAVNGISVKDLILLAGGMFLIFKSVHEIHAKMEGADSHHKVKEEVTFASVLIQIAILDLVFSLDSVITAVGMVDELWVMVVAVFIAIAVMVIFADPVSNFVEQHPTVKMLALSFLILIGVMLLAEGVGTHINKGYIYFAMAFSLIVEFLNMRVRVRPVHDMVETAKGQTTAETKPDAAPPTTPEG